MTGQIGGVYEIIAIAFGLIINAFNKRMLVYSLIGSLYYTRKPDHAEDSGLDNTLNYLRSNRTTRVEPKLREESKGCDTSINTNKFTPRVSSNLHRNSTFVQSEMETYDQNEQQELSDTIKNWKMYKISYSQIFYDWFKPCVFKKCKKARRSNKDIKFLSGLLTDETDFANIIDSIRQLKAHLKLQYDENQRSLLAFDKLYFIGPEHSKDSQSCLVHRIKRQISSKRDSENLRVLKRYSVSNPSILDNQIHSQILPLSRPNSLKIMIENCKNND